MRRADASLTGHSCEARHPALPKAPLGVKILVEQADSGEPDVRRHANEVGVSSQWTRRQISFMDQDRKNADYEIFLLRIVVGKDPVSGKALPNNSPWRNKEVTDAVRRILSIHEPDLIVAGTVDVLDSNVETDALDRFLDALTSDQRKIWGIIQENGSGILFSSICDKTGFSTAKVQGDLGVITKKSRHFFDPRTPVLNKRKGRYFPYQIDAPKQCADPFASLYHERMKEIQEKYPNAYARWSVEQERHLRALFEAKNSIQNIAKILERQPSAIRSRLMKLGLLEADRQSLIDVPPHSRL